MSIQLSYRYIPTPTNDIHEPKIIDKSIFSYKNIFPNIACVNGNIEINKITFDASINVSTYTNIVEFNPGSIIPKKNGNKPILLNLNLLIN